MNEKTCGKCGGSGSVKVTHGFCMGGGCNDCGQTGKVWVTCSECHGRGKVQE